jgi:inorganic triphosphatase YgiF
MELKAGLAHQAAARLTRRLMQLTGSAPQGPDRLRAVYFDSTDRRLQAAGVALRVRREGAILVLTVKVGRTASGGFHQVREVEARVSALRPALAAVPDPVLRQRMEALLDGATLQPWFETRVSRRRWQVRCAHGLVEVALDRGTIVAGARRQPILEAEFELLEGSPEVLFQLAEDLLGSEQLVLALPSKAARGAQLADGQPWRPLPGNSKPVAPPAGQDGAEAFRVQLDRLAAAVASSLDTMLQSDDPEGPHQLRVSLRRLRVALAMYKPLLEPSLAEHLADEARALGRRVAPLRDSDVLVGLYTGAATTAPTLGLALQAHGAEVRAAVRADVPRSGATGFVLELLGLAALGGWRRHGQGMTVEALASAALARLWRRTVRLGDRLSALSDEDRHELRKALKKLRYQLELAPVSFPRKPFSGHLRRLQEDLGQLNDFNVLESWMPDLPKGAAFQEARAALLKSSRHERDLALGRACRHWRDFRACPRPWVPQTPPSPLR